MRSSSHLLSGVAVVLVLFPLAASGLCPNPGPPPSSPLVVDLDGGGIHTTSIFMPVRFDLDADGFQEETTWVNPGTGDAFLALDLDGNGVIDDGRELFGDATLLPDGREAANGFEALAVYDEPAFGGDGDGMISPGDGVWNRLRLWWDFNYDGFSEPWELMPLPAMSVGAIGLEFVELNHTDGNLNLRWLKGSYVKRIERPTTFPPGPPVLRVYDVEDILFYSLAGAKPSF